MAKVKVVPNSANIIKVILKNEEIKKMCKDVAQARLPDGCEISEFVGYDRTHIVVKPVTSEAIQDNFENNTLEKAYFPTKRGK